jgi:thiol-disulfide isomerase/thioredoxin
MKNKSTVFLPLFIALSVSFMTACGSNQDQTNTQPDDNQAPNITSVTEPDNQTSGVTSFTEPDNQTSDVTSDTSTSKADTENDTVPAIVQSDSKVMAQNDSSFPSFSTTDLNGNAVDNKSFADYKITMINVWGTFCKPCIEEMPDLQTLSGQMPSGTRLVGLVADATDGNTINLAKQIVSENGVTYQNWLPDDALLGYVNDNITGVPTTIFVDSNGNIVGDAVVGVQSIDDYLNELNSRLK